MDPAVNGRGRTTPDNGINKNKDLTCFSDDPGRGRRKQWWPETGLNRRRRPFQGLNKLCFQLLRGLRGLPEYGEIRVKRVNHG
jgi:hypothetical protein